MTTQTLRSLYATADSSVWAVGYDTVLHFDGSSWAWREGHANQDAGNQRPMGNQRWEPVGGWLQYSDPASWTVRLGVDSFNTTMPHTFQGIWGQPQDIWAVGIDGSRGFLSLRAAPEPLTKSVAQFGPRRR